MSSSDSILSELSGVVDHDKERVLVIIVECETRLGNTNIARLKELFSDPYFTVQGLALESQGLDTSENYLMKRSLLLAQEGPYQEGRAMHWWSNLPVIIVKDSSVSNLTASGGSSMKERIQTSLSQVQNADLYFLCKWNDACDRYKDIESNKKSILKWSTRPTATQAILYTPKSRDYIIKSLTNTNVPLSEILNTNIERNTLLATVFVPNLIDFDINLAISNKDFAKLNNCAVVTESTTTSSNTASLWLAIIIIFVVLLALTVVQISPR